MTKAELIALLAPYPDDMTVFYWDAYDGTDLSKSYAEPDIEIERVVPHRNLQPDRFSVSAMEDTQTYFFRDGIEDYLTEGFSQDGEPFDAIIIRC